jgi:hypothetical protein
MSNCGEAPNEHEVQWNPREHEDEVAEALARDSDLDTDPALAISLERLDEQIRRRQS